MPAPELCTSILERVAARLVSSTCPARFQWTTLAAQTMKEFKLDIAQKQRQAIAALPVVAADSDSKPTPAVSFNFYFTTLTHAVGHVCALAVCLHLVNSRVLETCGWPGPAGIGGVEDPRNLAFQQRVKDLGELLWHQQSESDLKLSPSHGVSDPRPASSKPEQSRSQALSAAMQLLADAGGQPRRGLGGAFSQGAFPGLASSLLCFFIALRLAGPYLKQIAHFKLKLQSPT